MRSLRLTGEGSVELAHRAEIRLATMQKDLHTRTGGRSAGDGLRAVWEMVRY